MLLLISTRGWRRSPGVAAFVAGRGSHVVIDWLLARGDGFLIFWPLSVFRFPAPVSFWEPAYHGRAFSLICDGAIVFLLIRLAVLRVSFVGATSRSPARRRCRRARPQESSST